jgi:hypothetical protein
MVPIGKPLPRAPVVELGGGELLNCEWVGFCIHTVNPQGSKPSLPQSRRKIRFW